MAQTAEAPAPRLHPNLAEVYLREVATLIATLGQDDGSETRELVRGLVDHVTLHPEGKGQRVEVRGELAAILAMAGGTPNAKAAQDTADLAVQFKMAAGTRSHLDLLLLG